MDVAGQGAIELRKKFKVTKAVYDVSHRDLGEEHYHEGYPLEFSAALSTGFLENFFKFLLCCEVACVLGLRLGRGRVGLLSLELVV